MSKVAMETPEARIARRKAEYRKLRLAELRGERQIAAFRQPNSPTPPPRGIAAQLAAARGWVQLWESRYCYALDGFQRYHGLSRTDAIRRVAREMPDLVRGRDLAHSTLRRLGG